MGNQPWSPSGWSEPGEGDRRHQHQGTPNIWPEEFPPISLHVADFGLREDISQLPCLSVGMTLQPLLQEMQSLGALLAGRAMLHNSSHREGMLHVGKCFLIQIWGTG